MSITNGWMDIGNVDGVLFAIEWLSHNESEFIEFVSPPMASEWLRVFYLFSYDTIVDAYLLPLRRYPHLFSFLCINFVLFELYLFACESCSIGNAICLLHPTCRWLKIFSAVNSAQHNTSEVHSNVPENFMRMVQYSVRFIRFDWRRQVISKHMINDIPFLMQNSLLLNNFDCRRFKWIVNREYVRTWITIITHMDIGQPLGHPHPGHSTQKRNNPSNQTESKLYNLLCQCVATHLTVLLRCMSHVVVFGSVWQNFWAECSALGVELISFEWRSATCSFFLSQLHPVPSFASVRLVTVDSIDSFIRRKSTLSILPCPGRIRILWMYSLDVNILFKLQSHMTGFVFAYAIDARSLVSICAEPLVQKFQKDSWKCAKQQFNCDAWSPDSAIRDTLISTTVYTIGKWKKFSLVECH